MLLTADDMGRYQRHLTLSEIGYKGQMKIKNTKVLVVGAGGLGSSALYYLAAAGLTTIGIMDDDRVELSNLQRQILYTEHDIGKFKTEAATKRIQLMNAQLNINFFTEKFTIDSSDILKQFDIVIDATDSLDARYAINTLCFKYGIPFIYASILKFEGQCSLFIPGETGCYQCLFPKKPPNELMLNCNDAGVLGIIPGVLGCFQVNELVKYIVGFGETLANKLLQINLKNYQMKQLEIAKNEFCPCCQDVTFTTKAQETKIMPAIKQITYQDYQQLNTQIDWQVIDVRTPYEYEQGHLPSLLMPLDILVNHIASIDLTKPILVYCQHGVRSMVAANLLIAAGAADVYNWQEGYCVVKEI